MFIFFAATLFNITISEAKKPLIAKGEGGLECGIKNISKTIAIEVVDERSEKIEVDQDLLAHLEAQTAEKLKSCGYQISEKSETPTRKLKLTLTELWVDKEAGKIASRMDAKASLTASVFTQGEEFYNTQLTTMSSRTQPFVGRVIKKGKWALDLMGDLATEVASDSPLNAELSR